MTTDPRLARFLPIRIVLKKGPYGEYEGLIENSFSMDMSKHDVLIWWSGPAYSLIGEHRLDGVADAKGYVDRDRDGASMEVFDPLSDDCPVQVDWQRWLMASTKYSKRNAPFKQKHV